MLLASESDLLQVMLIGVIHHSIRRHEDASGHFDNDDKVGDWITYDTNGDVYKVTQTKPKKPA